MKQTLSYGCMTGIMTVFFIKATKSLKIVVLTCYLAHLPKIHR